MAEVIFWLSALLIIYAYAGYPLFLFLFSLVRHRPIAKKNFTPMVSVIVSAYNEEAAIRSKIKNILEQDYPEGRLDIIVASDGSTDRTDEIVNECENENVKLLRVEGRQGKTAAQNMAAKRARGDILLFTDATTSFKSDAVRQLVYSFADRQVGCVGGRLVYVSNGKSSVGAGGTDYWKYERTIKRLENSVSSLIGVSGCFYAVRKELYSDLPTHLISDFVIASMTYEKGYRVAYEDEAVTYEDTLEDAMQEFNMRIRVTLRTYSALWEKRHLLNPFKHGLFAIQLISHKILRYAVPLFLMAIFISNIFIADSFFYVATLVLQIVFYSGAIYGYFSQRTGKKKGLLAKPLYFVLANLAALIGLLKFLKGDQIITWTPVR